MIPISSENVVGRISGSLMHSLSKNSDLRQLFAGGALVLLGVLGKALADRIAQAGSVEVEVNAEGARLRVDSKEVQSEESD